MQNPRIRAILLFLLALTFGVLIFGGYLINQQKPPIPGRVVTEKGDVLFTGQDIMAGQQFYFSRGGQHIGTIWGHGSYLAPDWSADYLHRLGLYLAARHNGLKPQDARYFPQEAFDDLPAADRARLTALVTEEIKTNRYDPGDDTLTLTAFQAEALEALTSYYTELFVSGNEAMGLQSGIVTSDQEGAGLTRFFFWLAWAAGTRRPDVAHTYTTNWPYDPLVGNHPVPGTVIWSIVSVVLLILGIATALFFYLRYIRYDHETPQLVTDFVEPVPTASQKATLAYFLVAVLLFVVQIALGAVFSALEVVPLTLLGFEIVHNLNIARDGGPAYAYKWPVYFFISVAFWNLVGAGVFGFLINPPIVLYYAQGINTTPIHSHTALFGVYGMLAISLLLFSVRHIVTRVSWSDRLLKWSFWGLNGGLASMAVFSLIPSGFYQFYYAVKYGLWYARSPEIVSGPVLRALSWARMVPDIIFAVGAISLLLFLVRAIRISFFGKAAPVAEP